MDEKMKRGVVMLLTMCLLGGLAVGCSDDDPDYENVTPPVVEVAESSISGLVSAVSGDPVRGAAVTATVGSDKLTATTGADGTYVFSGVAKGTYTLEVTADGKLTESGSVTVSKDGEICVWNVLLTNRGKEVEVSQTEETKVEVTTETVKGNEEAEVKVEAVIPAAAVEEGATIIITPVYSTAAAESRAASQTLMFVGTSLACSKADATLKAAVGLSFQVDAEIAAMAKVRKFVGGKWVDVAATVVGGAVKFDADEFGSYALFGEVNVNTSTSTEAVSFSQSSFDNLYGSTDMTVSSATYTYKQGAELPAVSGKLSAQLKEVLAHQINGAGVKTMTGTYTLNVTLPVGTALNLSGIQEVTTVTVSSGSSSVSGKSYGSVTLSAGTYNRQHNGGSN